jgi:hypothetical protein
MDIFAHALWTGAVGLSVRHRIRRPISLGWLVFWGVFPDVFSFVIPAIVRISWYATGVTPHLLPDAKSPPHFQWVWHLYYASHSMATFAVVFGVMWLLKKRPPLVLLGWLFHILIDIPMHQGMFALHFLWPLSSFAISGVRWENRWFMMANYGALLLVFSWMWIKKRYREIRETNLAETVRDQSI